MELTAQEFILLLLAAIIIYYPEEIDDSLKPIDSSQCTFCDGIIFDFIIVGAGSAGSVLANRLTEIENWSVLLIEAGGDENFVSDVPLFYPYLSLTRFNWNYTTIPQKKACLSTRGICDYPRGKALGGSSTTNAMMYVRGNRADYDEWEEEGNPGWNYENVLRYFLKSENMTVTSLTNSSFHSTTGSMTIGYSKYLSPIRDDLIRAGIEFGLQRRDYNGLIQNGIDITQLTIKNGIRCSTAKAFLNPIRYRKNLFIYKNSHVTKVLISKKTKKALGVEFLNKNNRRRVFAIKEIILSAGSINTPKLLMLSGIGPAEHLKEKKIPIIANLPVGKNLQDHNLVGVQFLINQNVTIINSTFMNLGAILDYAKNRRGVLTSNGIGVLAFFNLNKTDSRPPEIQFHLTTLTPNPDNLPIVALGVTLLDPKSRGYVRLNSTNPFDPPLINPNYYGDKNDFNRTMKGVKAAINFMLNSSILRKYSPRFITAIVPNCINLTRIGLDSFLECYIKYHTRTIFHPVSTARMGPRSDPNTVVDSQLQVHGIKHLRVIDASVMPKITRGNTNAPTIMIAEKGADLIKNKYSPNLLSLLLALG